jgi:hypothetical protein
MIVAFFIIRDTRTQWRTRVFSSVIFTSRSTQIGEMNVISTYGINVDNSNKTPNRKCVIFCIIQKVI